MGNTVSKRRKDSRPSIVRSEVPDNELSNATATSVNSILVNANSNSIQRKAAPSNIITAQNTFKNATGGNKGFPNTISPPYSPTTESNNQLTSTSLNQLTATSIRSIGWNLDIDECISRLLDQGVKNKAPKSICFRNSEIVAICKAAQEVFLSQPVSFLKVFVPVSSSFLTQIFVLI